MGKVYLYDHIGPAFHEVFDDVFAGGHRHYWLKGGRGSLKSSGISLVIPVGIMQDPEANAIIYRKVKDTIYDSVYAQIVWALDKLGVLPLWHLGKSPMELTYRPTGQKILFRGADDPGKSKSIKLAKGYFRFVWFEELTEFQDMEEVQVITQSLLRGSNAHSACFYSYNPPRSAQSWVNGEALQKDADRLTHHSTYLDAPAQWLGDTFLKEAESLRVNNERAYRHAYLGEVTGTGGQVFDNVTVRPITELEYMTFDNPRYGLDFGFAVDPDACVRMYYNPALQRLYLFGEYYKAGSSFDATAAAIRRLNPEHRYVVADSAEPRSILELGDRGIHILGAKKGPGSVEHGVRWLQDRAEIVIDPELCPNAAREFLGYEYAPDGRGGFRAAYPDQDNHTIDAARYGLEELIGFKQAYVGRRGDIGL